MNTVEVLTAVRERLFEKGWRQDDFGEREGPNCIVGALERVGSTYEEAIDAELALEELLPGTNVVHFNDAMTTKFDDIIDLIDRTIKNEETKA